MKNFDTINILDIDVLNITMQETLACIDEIIATDRK